MKNLFPKKTKARKAENGGSRGLVPVSRRLRSAKKSATAAAVAPGKGRAKATPKAAAAAKPTPKPATPAPALPAVIATAAATAAVESSTTKEVLDSLLAAINHLNSDHQALKAEYGRGNKYNEGDHYDVGDPPVIVPGNAIAVLDLRTKTDLALSSFAYQIAANLTDNPYLPITNPSAAELRAAVNLFTDAITAREAGVEQLRSLTKVKDQVRTTLEQILKAVQLNVQQLSQGDGAVINSAGLPIKRGRTPTGDLSFPMGLVVNPGPVTGTLLVSWNMVPGSKGFLIQCAPADTMPRQWGLVKRTTNRTFLVEGLEAGKGYVFQVATAGGASGQSLWSPEVSRVCA